jgi:hypothetical protein
MSNLWKLPEQNVTQRSIRMELANNVSHMTKILEVWKQASQDSLQAASENLD